MHDETCRSYASLSNVMHSMTYGLDFETVGREVELRDGKIVMP